MRFSEWTSDKKLRAPIFQGFRDDIDPKQCRLEDSLAGTRVEAAGELQRKPPPLTPTIRQTRAVRRGRQPAFRPQRIEFTNLDKIFWPEDGYTKGDLIDYYDKISPLSDSAPARPAAGLRAFSERDSRRLVLSEGCARPHARLDPHARDSGRTTSSATSGISSAPIAINLLYIANTGNIQQNPWMSRVQHLDYPDYLVFDLDPVEAPYATVQKVAIVLKGVLDELGLRGYPKTSGASGIHVHLPVLENTFTYEDVRRICRSHCLDRGATDAGVRHHRARGAKTQAA